MLCVPNPQNLVFVLLQNTYDKSFKTVKIRVWLYTCFLQRKVFDNYENNQIYLTLQRTKFTNKKKSFWKLEKTHLSKYTMSSIQGKQWQIKLKKLNSYCDVQKYRALNITVTVRHFNGLVKKSMYI